MPALILSNPASGVQFTPTGATSADLLSTNAQAAIAEAYAKAVNIYSNQNIAGIKIFSDTTDATNSTTGIQFRGGIGIGKNAYIGGDLILPGLHTSGRILLRGYYIWIDASGNLRYKLSTPSSDTDGTLINPVAFSSFRVTKNNTLQTQITDNTVVIWNTEEFDNGNVFASNAFAAEATGLFCFSGAIALINNDVSVRTLGATLRVNSIAKARIGQFTVNASASIVMPFSNLFLSLNAGNTVDIVARNFGSTSYSIGNATTGAEMNYFSGFRVK